MTIRRTLRKLVWAAAVFTMAMWAYGAELDATMDFETGGKWLTEAPLSEDFDEGVLRCTANGQSFQELRNGLEIVAQPVRNGKGAGRWARTNYFPSVVAQDVPRDASEAKALTFWAHSQEPTGQTICLAVYSNSDKTPYRDFYYAFFRVDWKGWREIVLPRQAFQTQGEPAGWGAVEAIGLHARAFELRPHPATVLALDAMRWSNESPPADRSNAVPWPYPERPQEMVPFPADTLNHEYPETADGKPVYAPIEHKAYGKTSRAIHDYYPRFAPGPVSFSPAGQAFLRYGNIIETVDADGKWRVIDLLPAIRAHAIDKLGFARLRERDSLGQGDPIVRFDADGDAYALTWVHVWTESDRARYIGILLHSRDNLETWTAYALPHAFAYFEKLDGHNTECMKRPPVILLSKTWSPTENYLLIPEKLADGTLRIPPATEFCDNAAGVGGHSGDGNMAVTYQGKVYLVFAAMRPLGANPDDFIQKGKWDIRKKDGTKIPTPSYIRTYDIETGALSQPVYLGSSGRTIDAHNWPALTIDSKGYLHAILNGHHDPFVYVRSKKPGSIEEWTAPEPIEKMTTYGSLNCDAADTLYSVTRFSQRSYTFELGLHSKKAGRDWEAARVLVSPYRNYYYVWRHRLTLDPATGRLFLFYFARASNRCLFLDEYMALLHERPDYEKLFYDQKGDKLKLPRGTARSPNDQRKYAFFTPPPSEPAILVSEDGGDTWRLAVTADFLPRRGGAHP